MYFCRANFCRLTVFSFRLPGLCGGWRGVSKRTVREQRCPRATPVSMRMPLGGGDAGSGGVATGLRVRWHGTKPAGLVRPAASGLPPPPSPSHVLGVRTGFGIMPRGERYSVLCPTPVGKCSFCSRISLPSRLLTLGVVLSMLLGSKPEDWSLLVRRGLERGPRMAEANTWRV